MKFRVAGRHDYLLLAGLAFALLVVFQRSLQFLFNVAHDVERTYGVALMPALLILSVMFVFHMQANRREMRADALSATKETALARARTLELEHLMTFGQALSRTLTVDALHEAIWRHLPSLANGAEIWMLVRRAADWERVTDRAQTRWKAGEIEAVAESILQVSPEHFESPDGLEREGFICFVISAGGTAAGVIGIAAPGAAPEVRRTIGTAATLLGIALRNVQLFAEVREHGLRDGLTGCFNRAHGRETLDAEVARARRGETALSVVLFDVDQFKRINDDYGPLAGGCRPAAPARAAPQRLPVPIRRRRVHGDPPRNARGRRGARGRVGARRDRADRSGGGRRRGPPDGQRGRGDIGPGRKRRGLARSHRSRALRRQGGRAELRARHRSRAACRPQRRGIRALEGRARRARARPDWHRIEFPRCPQPVQG
jgi:GAF domain-containing protein